MQDISKPALDEIKVGDVVRSHDSMCPERHVLNGEMAKYIIGTVVRIRRIGSCDRYEIRSYFRVFCGAVEAHSETYYAPANGTPTNSGGVTCGVKKI